MICYSALLNCAHIKHPNAFNWSLLSFETGDLDVINQYRLNFCIDNYFVSISIYDQLLFLSRKQFQEQCKLVVEENHLLMEQLDLQQNKEKEIHKTYMQEGEVSKCSVLKCSISKIKCLKMKLSSLEKKDSLSSHLVTFQSFFSASKLSQKVSLVEREKAQLKLEVDELRAKYDGLKRKYDEGVINSRLQLDMDEHENIVAQMKRYIKLSLKYCIDNPLRTTVIHKLLEIIGIVRLCLSCWFATALDSDIIQTTGTGGVLSR